MKTSLLICIAFIVLLLMPSLGMAQESKDGLRMWLGTEVHLESDSAQVGRLGYQINDIEPFVGVSLIPKQESDAGENIDEATIISLGGLLHLPDLIDPNAPVPWIPQVLLEFFPEKAIAAPYIGWQGSWNIVNDDSGYHGGVGGLLAKLSPSGKAEGYIEVQYNFLFDQLNKLRANNDWVYSFGLRFRF